MLESQVSHVELDVILPTDRDDDPAISSAGVEGARAELCMAEKLSSEKGKGKEKDGGEVRP